MARRNTRSGYGAAMRNAILLMMLAVVSGSAAAEWVEVGGNELITSYADPTTIHSNGSMVKMWTLFDLKTARISSVGKPYLSSKSEDEFDCKKKRRRTLSFSWHAGNMGEGEIVASNANPDEWAPVALRTVREALWKMACAKRYPSTRP